METRATYFILFLEIVAMFVVVGGLCAQPTAVKFEHLSLEQGLSQSTVYAIVQDGEGFMWFGTQDGLNSFNSAAISVYRHSAADSHSISDNGIWSMCRADSSDFWIGTMRGGLNRYVASRNHFMHFSHVPSDSTSLSDPNVTAVFVDSRNVLWVGTLNGGLNRYDEATRSFVRHSYSPTDPNSLSNNTVWSIAEDAEHNIWIATWEGVCRLDRAAIESSIRSTATPRFRRFTHDPKNTSSLSGNNARTILVDRQGNVWIGTWGDGLNRYDPKRNLFTHYKTSAANRESISSNLILCLFEDRAGTVWIGTGDAGLNKYDPATDSFIHYRHNPNDPTSLNNDIICTVYEDDAGALWIGTGAGGVNRYDKLKNRFSHYRHEQNNASGISGNDVWAILEDGAGDLWVGTYGKGLNRADKSRKRFQHYAHNPKSRSSISHDKILSLAEGRDGTIWIGTEGGGLNKFNRTTNSFTTYVYEPRNRNSLSQNEITAILEDKRGRVWLGTNGGGLDRLDPATGQFTHFYPDERDSTALSSGSILAIHEDHQGVIWVGTWGGGLNKFVDKSESFVHFLNDPANPSSLNNNSVLSIYSEGTGKLWLGTYGGGLNRLDPQTGNVTHFTESEGLANNVVYGILPDGSGNLWLTTNKGLSRFNTALERFRNYDVHDGLQGNEFNQGAYFRSRSGELFVGGINGFNAFYPDSVRDNPHIPQIHLTSFNVFGESIPLESAVASIKNISLSHAQNFISFEFVSLNYSSPEKNMFAYMLEGLDTKWNYVGNRRYASYANLDHGEYTLRVIGSNNDGVWNNQGITVAITIVPPFWKTWWFILLAILTGCGLLFYFYRLHVNRLLAIERLRVSIATDLHDDIGSTLTEIALFSDVGARQLRSYVQANSSSQKELTKVSSLLEEIGGTSRNLIDAMNDIVWSINPQNDSFEFLLLRMKTHAARIFDGRGINYQIDMPPELSHLHLPLSFRRGLFLIFKEALNNILRHAQPTDVKLSIKAERRQLFMTIADNGVGFDSNGQGEGNGLRNMKQRAATLGGRLEIESERRSGTTIRVQAPIP